MSDPALTSLDFLRFTDKQMIMGVLAESIIADYGIVKAVTDNKTVDVEHAVRRVVMGGISAVEKPLEARITQGVELLFPSSASFGQSWTVAPGDGVLLIGLQNMVTSTEGLTKSSVPAEFWHYSAQTMKAIPLQAIRSDSEVQFGEENGKAFLRTATASLYTFLKTQNDALQTFMGAASQSSITSAGASPTPAPLAAAIVALMASFAASTATLVTDLENLLEA